MESPYTNSRFLPVFLLSQSGSVVVRGLEGQINYWGPFARKQDDDQGFVLEKVSYEYH